MLVMSPVLETTTGASRYSFNHSSRTVPLNSSHFALDMSSMLRKKPSADVGGGVEESLGELLFLFNEMSILRPSRSREYLPLFLAWKM